MSHQKKTEDHASDEKNACEIPRIPKKCSTFHHECFFCKKRNKTRITREKKTRIYGDIEKERELLTFIQDKS